MIQSSMRRYRLQALVLVGGALLALIALIVAAAGPPVSCHSAVMAQEPAVVAGLAPADDPGPADFDLSVYPPEQGVGRSGHTSYTISVIASPGDEYVSLDVGPLPLPDWMEHILDPASPVPPGEVTLTLTVTHNAITGTYPLIVTGTARDLTAEAHFTLTVLNDVFLPAVARDCWYVCEWQEPENNDRSGAIPLALDSEYESYICPGDPGDYFSVTLDSPTTLVLDLTNLAKLPPGVDYDLYLFNEAGDQLAYSIEYPQIDEHIEYDIDQAGDYYILVYPYSGSSSDVPYVLTVSTGS